MNREPSPSDTMPLARVTADNPDDDGGKHRRPEDGASAPEVSPPESPGRRRIAALFPVAVAVVALALAGAVVYGANHQVEGTGTADPAGLPGQPGAVLPPDSPTSTTPSSASATAPPASADVRAQASSSDVVTTTPKPPAKPSAPIATGGNGPGNDTSAIESSIAASIMSSLQSRFGGPPQPRH